MLIIYDDNGNIKFSTSDDYYVNTYFNKHKKFPFIQYGTKAIFLRGDSYIEDTYKYKIIDNKLVKRDDKEIASIEESRKNKIKKKMFVVKNVEVVEEIENAENVKPSH